RQYDASHWRAAAGHRSRPGQARHDSRTALRVGESCKVSLAFALQAIYGTPTAPRCCRARLSTYMLGIVDRKMAAATRAGPGCRQAELDQDDQDRRNKQVESGPLPEDTQHGSTACRLCQ